MAVDNSERYDRQIRLWGQQGQARLEKTRVCVLGSGMLVVGGVDGVITYFVFCVFVRASQTVIGWVLPFKHFNSHISNHITLTHHIHYNTHHTTQAQHPQRSSRTSSCLVWGTLSLSTTQKLTKMIWVRIFFPFSFISFLFLFFFSSFLFIW